MTTPITKVTREEFKAALKLTKTRRDHRFPLSNGWFVRADRVYPEPARIGPAWHYVFYLESPTRKTFGGRTSMAEMVSYFCNPHFWKWEDAYGQVIFGSTAEHMQMRSEGGV